MSGLVRNGTLVDFVWSIPMCAIDDTQNPPAVTACAGESALAGRAAESEELAGSHRSEPRGAVVAGEIDPDEPLTVTLTSRGDRPSLNPAARRISPGSMRPITRRALDAERLRTHRQAATRIIKFVEDNGIVVHDVDYTRRRMKLEAPTGRLAELFGVSLGFYHDGKRTFRARSGPLRVPRAIAPWTRAVLGFDQRPQVASLAAGTGNDGLWPTEIAHSDGIPLDQDVTSQCVGIIALGGGYRPTDLSTALARMGRAAPIVVDHSVGGVTNQWSDGSKSDEEIALDLQVLAGLMPGARIVVYFTANTSAALAEAMHEAVLDEENRPQVLSISWGSAEKYWTNQTRAAVQAALADAVTRKITVVAAAGDELATSGVSDGKAHVWFPASSPYVLGCGGTAITLGGAGIASDLLGTTAASVRAAVSAIYIPCRTINPRWRFRFRSAPASRDEACPTLPPWRRRRLAIASCSTAMR